MRPLVLLMACACLSACASDPFSSPGSDLDLSPAAQEAFAVLQAAPFFSDGCVGFACTTPPTVEAWRVLHDEPDADAAFKALLHDATKAGQLFGLVGVYYTDAARFTYHAKRVRRTNASVDYWLGCVNRRAPVAEVVAEIEAGTLPENIRGR